MGESMSRDDLLLLTGAARGVCSICAAHVLVSARTALYYRRVYERWLASGQRLPEGISGAKWRWWAAAIRFGALERLGLAAANLEAALRDHDGSAESHAEIVDDCLKVLERFPGGRSGWRVTAEMHGDRQHEAPL